MLQAHLQLPLAAKALGYKDRGLHRLLFKHATPQEARGPSFYSDLKRQIVGGAGNRRLLLGIDLDLVGFSALDRYTGIDVLEAPTGPTASAFLQALQQHPGELLTQVFDLSILAAAGKQGIRVSKGGVSWRLMDAEMEFVEEDLPLSAFGAGEPNDPNVPQQWALFTLGLFDSADNVNASNATPTPVAWDRTTGSANITVCVIDSGVDFNHPDLQVHTDRDTTNCSRTQ